VGFDNDSHRGLVAVDHDRSCALARSRRQLKCTIAGAFWGIPDAKCSLRGLPPVTHTGLMIAALTAFLAQAISIAAPRRSTAILGHPPALAVIFHDGVAFANDNFRRQSSGCVAKRLSPAPWSVVKSAQ